MLTRTWSLLLSPALLCLNVAAAEPEVFTAPDGKFSIKFAAKPMELEQKTPGGTTKTYLAIKGDDTQAVTVTENPSLALATPEIAEMIMDKSRDGIVGKGKLIAEKKIKLNDKYSGRDFIVQTDNPKGFMHLRMYLADSTLYMLMVVGQTEEAVKSKENTAYLDSFKLGKK
jgi:hypothetical protein